MCVTAICALRVEERGESERRPFACERRGSEHGVAQIANYAATTCRQAASVRPSAAVPGASGELKRGEVRRVGSTEGWRSYDGDL